MGRWDERDGERPSGAASVLLKCSYPCVHLLPERLIHTPLEQPRWDLYAVPFTVIICIFAGSLGAASLPGRPGGAAFKAFTPALEIVGGAAAALPIAR